MRHPQQLDMRAVQAMYPRADEVQNPIQNTSKFLNTRWRTWTLYASPGIVWTGAMIGLAVAVRW